MVKKILVITPRFPLPATGACEQDRLAGLLQLKRLGYDLRVIAKVFDFQDKNLIQEWGRVSGIKIDLLPYEFRSRSLLDRFRQIFWPPYWDGAAYEYATKSTNGTVDNIVREWLPGLVWFDYTYLWPLYGIFKKRHIPIVTRSINFEPQHFLQEDGHSFLNILKVLPKYLSEFLVARMSSLILSITPKERLIYERLGSKRAFNLPLRGLLQILANDHILTKKHSVLNIYYSPSNFNVHHNLRALDFVLDEIVPELDKLMQNRYKVFITGSKMPSDRRDKCVGAVMATGYIEKYDEFLSDMDVALAPSLSGAGMQQKVFEPIARGIATVTHPRAIAGYPFISGTDCLFAESGTDYAQAIAKLADLNYRKRIAKAGSSLARTLFSGEVSDRFLRDTLDSL